MKTTTGLKVKATVKATSRSNLRVRAGVRSGGCLVINHNRRGLAIKSSVRAGSGHFGSNHNARLLSIG